MYVFGQKKRIYLDTAAATMPSPRALRVYEAARKHGGNPSSFHTEGRNAHEVLEAARERIASLCEVQTDAVVFTGNATEANALGILGHLEALHLTGRSYSDMHVLYAPGAHASVVHNVEALAACGALLEPLTYKHGELDREHLSKQITKNTVLVAVPAVCGETGLIYPVRDIRRVLDARKSTAVLFVDACQLPLVAPYELTRLGASMISLDASKVCGVRGIGALIAPRRIALAPLYFGGGQERGLRPSTPAPALAAAFAEALTEAKETRDAFLSHTEALRRELCAVVETIPNSVVNIGKAQAPHIVSLSFPGRDTDYLVALLDEAGFAVSTKSACETDSPGSRAVLAHTDNPKLAESTLRVSFGRNTTSRDIAAFSRALVESVNFLDTAGIL